jgi:ABC-type Na+ efflux pump permease subunit
VARDVPAAQNLSRPVFGVLLLVFFVSLAQLSAAGGGGGGVSWLAWIPPFTPFVMLMAEPGAIAPGAMAAGLLGMAAVTLVCGRLASLALRDQPLLRALAWPGKRRGAVA